MNISIDHFPDEQEYEQYFDDLKKKLEKELIKLMEEDRKKENKQINNKIIIKKPNIDKYQIEKCVSFENVFKEIPSRSLILCNIPEGTTEEDIKYLLIQFGDYEILTFDEYKINVRFYNILDAMMMRCSTIYIQSKSIMMCFGKDFPVEDKRHPPNNGTIIVFNLPEKVSNDEIVLNFSPFGQIKDIRKTPNNNTQRFIEFYDSRSAKKARNTMKKKKLIIAEKPCILNTEYSLPGNYRANYEKFCNHRIPTIQKRYYTKMN